MNAFIKSLSHFVPNMREGITDIGEEAEALITGAEEASPGPADTEKP